MDAVKAPRLENCAGSGRLIFSGEIKEPKTGRGWKGRGFEARSPLPLAFGPNLSYVIGLWTGISVIGSGTHDPSISFILTRREVFSNLINKLNVEVGEATKILRNAGRRS